MDVSIHEARAPWVEFQLVAEEDRNASIAAGVYTTKDVEYVIVTPAGSKDRVVREVKDWLDQKDIDAKNGRVPAEWVRAWRFAYKEWKEGRELPVQGTPILTWPPLSPSQRQSLITWKVMTVEALAECNEDVILRLGMGGRKLKQMAVDWLKASNDVGKVTMEVGALREKFETMERRNKHLEEQNAIMAMQLKAIEGMNQPVGTIAPEPAGFLDDEGSGGFISDSKDQLRHAEASAFGRKL